MRVIIYTQSCKFKLIFVSTFCLPCFNIYPIIIHHHLLVIQNSKSWISLFLNKNLLRMFHVLSLVFEFYPFLLAFLHNNRLVISFNDYLTLFSNSSQSWDFMKLTIAHSTPWTIDELIGWVRNGPVGVKDFSVVVGLIKDGVSISRY